MENRLDVLAEKLENDRDNFTWENWRELTILIVREIRKAKTE